MKVLLSAYACEPNRGSEPGVGWNWALELSRLGHQVWVLTRENNRSVIESELAAHPELQGLKFLYFDLPSWARWWKRGSMPILINLYYALWQWGAYRLAKNAHAVERFDVVHHLTFGVFRQPSFLGRLGIPFIFGPVGGGEAAPWRLRKSYSFKGWVLDALRDIVNGFSRFDPFLEDCLARASVIYVKTQETAKILPAKYQSKIRQHLEIGLPRHVLENPTVKEQAPTSEEFRVLYVGRFIDLKGMHLGLRAFAEFQQKYPNSGLTMVGTGPQEGAWRKLAEKLGIGNAVEWIGWVNQKELAHIYGKHDVFLFPSLHDTSGNVVLEALVHGLPVICLDLGGPVYIANEQCGRIVTTSKSQEADVVRKLSEAMYQLASEHELREDLSRGALLRARDFAWPHVVQQVYYSPSVAEVANTAKI